MPPIALISDVALTVPVERFFGRPDIAANLALLGGRLPAAARILVAGGALRNLLIESIHGGAPSTRDIDIFIDGLAADFSLSSLLHDQRCKTTDLAGVRWYPGGSPLAFDLCRLPDFLGITAGRLDPTPQNLLRGIDFTANAIIYDVATGSLRESGCIAAVRRRRLDFNSRVIPDKRLMAYRILLIAHKIGFHLSESVFDYVRQRLDLETVAQVKRLLHAKRGPAEAAAIMAAYDRLCRFSGYGAYRDAMGGRPAALKTGRPGAS